MWAAITESLDELRSLVKVKSVHLYELTNDEAELLDGHDAIGLEIIIETAVGAQRDDEYKFWLLDGGTAEIASARGLLKRYKTKRNIIKADKKNYSEQYNADGDLNDLAALSGIFVHVSETELFDCSVEALKEVPDFPSDPKIHNDQWALLDPVAYWYAGVFARVQKETLE